MKAETNHTYDLLVFDWDGTAVPDRKASIPDLLEALERVLCSGVRCVIITGTNADNLLEQGLDRLTPRAKDLLRLCTNRGSEVWQFSRDGTLELAYQRKATSNENAALDRAAIGLQTFAAQHGLETKIIFKRLNRRKIDLIREPKWADPKKSEFRELLGAVKRRLKPLVDSMGLENRDSEIAILLKEAHRISRDAGLANPRITSDIKHIEIGLTDKSDSVRWVYHKMIVPQQLPLTHVAVLGDEFGSIGGVQGSDALLYIPEIQDAEFFSVGVEPEGTPPWVAHLGGGPKRFVQFLNDQVPASDTTEKSEQDLAWQIIQEGFEPSREREMETLFAIGNGNLGIRATADFPVPAAQPDLFIAGVYDRKAGALPYSEIEFLTNGNRNSLEAELVPFPSPFQYTLRLDGSELSSLSNEMKSHTRTLNLKNGLYGEEHAFEDKLDRRTKISSSRFASLTHPNLLIQRIQITPENYSAPIELDFSLDDRESLHPHLDRINNIESNGFSTLEAYQTKGSKITSVIASRIFIDDAQIPSAKHRLIVNPGETLNIDRIIAVFTSRYTPRPEKDALEYLSHLNSHVTRIYDEQLTLHTEAWDNFWSKADLSFCGNIEATQAQRFNLYHLRIAASSEPTVSIPAKGLTGRAYEGHVFWDTEIFMFPFFLYTEPELAKSFLMYRYHTLGGAKARAKKLGYRGACYAWESTVTGADVTPKSILVAGTKEEIPIFTGTQQIHVTADIAFAVWKYWDATLDESFLRDQGAEILAETARFWVSRLSHDQEHLVDIVGPDEYHHGVKDNAYTNWMARFNLEKAVWAWDYLQGKWPDTYRELSSKLGLGPNEINQWKVSASRVFIPKPDARGVIEQFQGFHSLQSIPIPEHERYHAPVSRLFNWRQINGMKIIKQADVLMIPFLFPNALSSDVIVANYNYYEPLTDHASSLSLCVHAAIAGRIGKRDEAKRYWDKSLSFDLDNAMSNSGLGIHAAALGGTWQALVFHMLGIELTPHGPRFTNSRSEASDYAKLFGTSTIDLKLTYRGKLYPVRFGGKGRQVA